MLLQNHHLHFSQKVREFMLFFYKSPFIFLLCSYEKLKFYIFKYFFHVLKKPWVIANIFYYFLIEQRQTFDSNTFLFSFYCYIKWLLIFTANYVISSSKKYIMHELFDEIPIMIHEFRISRCDTVLLSDNFFFARTYFRTTVCKIDEILASWWWLCFKSCPNKEFFDLKEP